MRLPTYAAIAVSAALVLGGCSFGGPSVDEKPTPTPRSAASSSKRTASSRSPAQSSVASSSSSEIYTGSFRRNATTGAHEGTLTVTGYPEIETHAEGFCEKDCETFAYVYLHVTDGLSDVLKDYILDLQGNTFVKGTDGIGIGCKTVSDAIRVDANYKAGPVLSPEISSVILSATKEHPVILKLAGRNSTWEGEVKDCYSHFIVLSAQ